MILDDNGFVEIETGLLGSVIIDADYCLEELLTVVTADDFLSVGARRIWEAICDLHSEGKKVDPYTVKARAGEAYDSLVEQITNTVPTAANWQAYLSELKRKGKLIKAEQISRDIYDDALSGTADIDELRTKAEHLVSALENSDAIKNDFSAKEMAVNFIKDFDKPREYLDWGMQTLNRIMLCERGDYVLIGATPSTGKTALSLQFLVSMAKSGKNVLYFSFETSAKKIMQRISACHGRISYDRIRRGTCTYEERKSAIDVMRMISKLPFRIIESSGYTVDDIRSKAIKHRADVIYIDYIQQVRHKNPRLSEYERTTENSIAIQQLCKKYKITTIALSQLSRLSDDKKPGLSSFRSSGQLEQDADFGILFYRPEKLEEGQPDTDRIFSIAKNKDGPVMKIKMHFEGDFQTFTVVDNWRQERETGKWMIF